MIRPACYLGIVLAGLTTLTSEASGQLNLGAHVARAADVFGGATGLGASVELDLPLLPDLMLAGEYFMVDCEEGVDCSFAGGSADLHFGLPIPTLQPYATGGVAFRRHDAGGSSGPETNVGVGIGAGVNLRALVIGAYVEARYEIVDPDDQFVFRLGIRF